jgi:hypothetical protein
MVDTVVVGGCLFTDIQNVRPGGGIYVEACPTVTSLFAQISAIGNGGLMYLTIRVYNTFV